MNSSSRLDPKLDPHPDPELRPAVSAPGTSLFDLFDRAVGVIALFLALTVATLMLLGIVERQWQPPSSGINLYVIGGMWSSLAAVVFSLVWLPYSSVFFRVSAAMISFASVVAVTGWGWNQWAWGVTFTTNVLGRPLGQSEFVTLTAIGGFSVVGSWLICTIPALRRRIDRGESLFFHKSSDYLWLLVAMIAANVLAQFDLRGKTSFLFLQYSLIATLTWGTYLDAIRHQSFSTGRSWVSRLLCFVPSLFFIEVIYFQQPQSKGEIYFYLGWIISALCCVSLLPSAKRISCLPSTAQSQPSAMESQRFPWPTAIRIGFRTLIAGLILYGNIFHLPLPQLFLHLQSEQIERQAFSIISRLQQEQKFTFRFDHKLNELLEISLNRNSAPDVLTQLPFSTASRNNGLIISGLQPTTQIPNFGLSGRGLEIVDSQLTLDQLTAILDRVVMLQLTRCEIVANAVPATPGATKSLFTNNGPLVFAETAPGNISSALPIITKMHRGAIDVTGGTLDQNDLIALLQAPHTLKKYSVSSNDLATLENTIQRLPIKVRGNSPPLQVEVAGVVDLSPENFPNLWLRALAGDLLLVADFENLDCFYLSGFVQQPTGNLQPPKTLLSFLPEQPSDSTFMFSADQLRDMHWLNPSDDKPQNRDKLDTLWVPNVMFLNHIEPELLHSLTKLSINSLRFGRVINERWDNRRQVSAEKILSTLENLECLEIGEFHYSGTNLTSLPDNLKVLESRIELALPYDLILSGKRLEKIILAGGPPKGKLQELANLPEIQFVLLVPRDHAAATKRDLLAFNAPHIKVIVVDHPSESVQTSWYQFHQLMIQRVRDRIQAAAKSQSPQPPK